MPVRVATVRAADVPATQTNFPFYVDLGRVGATALTLADAQSSRWYTDTDLVTQMAREIVSLTEGHGKYASLTSTSKIAIDYDGIRADYAVGDTYGRNAVWSDYEMVLHLESGVSDSTGNGHAQTAGSGITTGVTGKVGKGSQYSGSSSYSFVNGTFAGGTSDRTLTAWVKSDVTTGNRFAYSYGLDAAQRMMGFTSFNTTNWYSTVNSGDNDTGVAINTSVYQKLTIQYTGTQVLVHVDGVLEVTRTITINTGTGNFTIGNYPGQTGVPLDGIIDELRFRPSETSTNWETTEYNNQNDEATFWGTWTTFGGGPAAVNARRLFLMMV